MTAPKGNPKGRSSQATGQRAAAGAGVLRALASIPLTPRFAKPSMDKSALKGEEGRRRGVASAGAEARATGLDRGRRGPR